MTLRQPAITGGCLCGAVRYVVVGEPLYMGHCYCRDCQRASGSGFVPFMGVASTAMTVRGPLRAHVSGAARGGVATRNRCASCGSLVFGGVPGESDSYTIYAGTLDDPARFVPRVAIFVRDRPPWALLPAGLTLYEEMPP